MQGYVWDRLPTVSRTIMGRRLVGRIVKRSLANWPAPVLQQCDAAQTAVVAKHYTKTIERQSRGEYGMGIIAMFILGALVQEIIKLLVAWWLDSQDNRTAMMTACEEARHHD